jgi:hypothetical protein
VGDTMKNEKAIALICYLSILFLPLILPIIVFIFSKEKVRYHAKRALISHIIPVLPLLPMVYHRFFNIFMDASPIILLFVFYLVISVVTVIWNVLQGIKVIRNDL